MQPPVRQVHEQALELTERTARLIGLFRRLHGLKGLHSFDKHERPPEFTVAPDVVGLTVARRDDDERTAGDVARARGLELAAEMRGDAHDVFHHRQRFLEHVPVDLLVDVAHAHPALVVGGGIGFVDVADLKRLGVQDLAVDLKLP